VAVELGASRAPDEARPRRAPSETPAPRRFRAVEVLGIVALLGVLGVVLPAIVASHYGALDIPRSDDWSYLLTLFHWVDSGRLTFNGWVSMTLIGQIATAAPIAAIFGHNITAIHLYTSLLGLVGLVGVVFLGRRALVSLWAGVFVAVTIAIGPLWSPLSATFMTDIPTFTAELLALCAAARAIRRSSVSLPWFAGSLALGFYGVTIRQYAVVPLAAIVLVAITVLVANREWRQLRIVIGLTAICGVAVLALLVWWSGLPDSKSLSPKVPTLHTISAVLIKDAGFLRLAGFVLAPVIVLAGPVRIVRRAWRASPNLTTLLATLTTLWLAAMYLHVPKTPFAGAYVTRDGVLSNFVLAGTRPDIMPSALYGLLILIGSIGGVLIVLAAVPFLADLPRRFRERQLLDLPEPVVALMGWTTVGFAAAYSLVVVTGLPVYDRYALPFLPLVALLVLHSTQHEPVTAGSRSRGAWAGVAIVLLAVVGFVYTVDSASFDGTRWKVAEAAVRKGYTATQVSGGAEWLGYHRQHGPVVAPSDAGTARQQRSKHYALPCVTMVVNPPPGSRRIVAEAEYRTISRSPVKIVAFRTKRPCAR
jgi:hypothetical protein